jgi:hypothetical protein
MFRNYFSENILKCNWLTSLPQSSLTLRTWYNYWKEASSSSLEQHVTVYLPPSRSSAVPCATSCSFFTKHWYMPWSSLVTDGRWRISLVMPGWTARPDNGWPSLNQRTETTGCPAVVQEKRAGWPSAAVWRAGETRADRGDVTSRFISIRELPAELLAIQR